MHIAISGGSRSFLIGPIFHSIPGFVHSILAKSHQKRLILSILYAIFQLNSGWPSFENSEMREIDGYFSYRGGIS